MYSTVLQVFSAQIFQLNEAKQLYLNQPLTQQQRLPKLPLKPMPIIIFLIDLFGMVKPCESLYNVVDIENQYLRLKNEYINIFLFFTCILILIKIVVLSP